MMKRILKWFDIGLGAMPVLAAVAVGVIYAASEVVLRHVLRSFLIHRFHHCIPLV